MGQPVKKGQGIKKGTGLSALKDKMNLRPSEKNITVSNADKPMEWLIMPKAFQDATRLSGIPCGYCNLIAGFSDVGKSTLVGHILSAAQHHPKPLIPVIYDTENNLDWTYLKNMGFEAEPVYGDVDVEEVDPETGEIKIVRKNEIIGYDGNFLYFNNRILAERYGNFDYSTGKETKQKRKEAVIEDIAASMKELLDAQDAGEVEAGFVFVWDSIGSITSYRSYKSLTNSNLFDAGAVSVAFSSLLNNRIPSSRKQSSKYTNTFIGVNKVWLDSMTAPMAQPIMKMKNGETMYYATHGLIIQLGGAITRGIKHLKATAKGAKYKYGIESKIKVIKNQLPSPYTLSYEGPIICTPHGFIAEDELAQYQKEHISEMLSELQSRLSDTESVTAADVSFISEDDE